MATSMTLGVTGMNLNLGTSSPMVGGSSSHGGNGSIGNLTPSHNGIKYGGNGGGSGASSVPSPASSVSSTPSSTITINGSNSGSMGKGPGSVNSNNNSNGSLGLNTSNTNGDTFGSKCKRKINFSNLGIPPRGHQPATVARRNARERNRVKQVNNGFAALKQHIPLGHRSKKMSKVETLRCAVDYIKNLKGLLTIHNTLNSTSPVGSSISGDGMMEMEDENQEQGTLQAHQQHQMNNVNNQQEAYALSSSSTSSSPTLSDFGAAVAHLPHLTALHALHPQQHLGNNNTNQLRHLSLSHHQMHGTNSVSVAAALLVESNNNAMTPNSNQLSPTSSDDPSSPYTSEASYVNSNGNMKGNVMYDYENYEPASPEDDELLDAIAFWQQS